MHVCKLRKCLGWQHSAYQRKPKDIHRTRYKRLSLEYIEDSYMRRLRIIDKLINTGVLKDNHQLKELLSMRTGADHSNAK